MLTPRRKRQEQPAECACRTAAQGWLPGGRGGRGTVPQWMVPKEPCWRPDAILSLERGCGPIILKPHVPACRSGSAAVASSQACLLRSLPLAARCSSMGSPAQRPSGATAATSCRQALKIRMHASQHCSLGTPATSSQPAAAAVFLAYVARYCSRSAPAGLHAAACGQRCTNNTAPHPTPPPHRTTSCSPT